MSSLRNKALSFTDHPGDCSELTDVGNRLKKAKKIKAVLNNHVGHSNKKKRILDLGCSYGIILNEFSDEAILSVGVDLDLNALKKGSVPNTSVCSDAESLPFMERSIDLIICNHVYEHTENAQKLIREIYRVLDDAGHCYFAGPNKYSLLEPHYELPFLSWFPKSVANIYLRLAKGIHSYDVRPYSYKGMTRLIHKFISTEYTEKILRNPENYHVEDMIPQGSIKQKLAIGVYRFLRFIFPDFVFILQKQ